MWDTTKAVLWGKYIALNAYLREEKSQINNLNFHLQKVEKETQNEPKASQRQETIHMGPEIKDRGSRKTNEKINERKDQYDWQTFRRLTEEKKEKKQMMSIRNEMGDITTDPLGIKRISNSTSNLHECDNLNRNGNGQGLRGRSSG